MASLHSLSEGRIRARRSNSNPQQYDNSAFKVANNSNLLDDEDDKKNRDNASILFPSDTNPFPTLSGAPIFAGEQNTGKPPKPVTVREQRASLISTILAVILFILVCAALLIFVNKFSDKPIEAPKHVPTSKPKPVERVQPPQVQLNDAQQQQQQRDEENERQRDLMRQNQIEDAKALGQQQKKEHETVKKEPELNTLSADKLDPRKLSQEARDKANELLFLTKKAIEDDVSIKLEVFESGDQTLEFWFDLLRHDPRRKKYILFYFGAHPSFNIPEVLTHSMRGNREELRRYIKPTNAIFTLAYFGYISKVVWVRPSFAPLVVPAGIYPVTIGNIGATDHIGVDSVQFSYVFMNYASPDLLKNTKRFEVEIIDMKKGKEFKLEDIHRIVGNHKHLLIDVNLNFFSSMNPYHSFVSKQLKTMTQSEFKELLRLVEPHSYCASKNTDFVQVSKGIRALVVYSEMLLKSGNKNLKDDQYLNLVKDIIPHWCKGKADAVEYFTKLKRWIFDDKKARRIGYSNIIEFLYSIVMIPHSVVRQSRIEEVAQIGFKSFIQRLYVVTEKKLPKAITISRSVDDGLVKETQWPIIEKQVFEAITGTYIVEKVATAAPVKVEQPKPEEPVAREEDQIPADADTTDHSEHSFLTNDASVTITGDTLSQTNEDKLHDEIHQEVQEMVQQTKEPETEPAKEEPKEEKKQEERAYYDAEDWLASTLDDDPTPSSRKQRDSRRRTVAPAPAEPKEEITLTYKSKDDEAPEHGFVPDDMVVFDGEDEIAAQILSKQKGNERRVTYTPRFTPPKVEMPVKEEVPVEAPTLNTVKDDNDVAYHDDDIFDDMVGLKIPIQRNARFNQHRDTTVLNVDDDVLQSEFGYFDHLVDTREKDPEPVPEKKEEKPKSEDDEVGPDTEAEVDFGGHNFLNYAPAHDTPLEAKIDEKQNEGDDEDSSHAFLNNAPAEGKKEAEMPVKIPLEQEATETKEAPATANWALDDFDGFVDYNAQRRADTRAVPRQQPPQPPVQQQEPVVQVKQPEPEVQQKVVEKPKPRAMYFDGDRQIHLDDDEPEIETDYSALIAKQKRDAEEAAAKKAKRAETKKEAEHPFLENKPTMGRPDFNAGRNKVEAHVSKEAEEYGKMLEEELKLFRDDTPLEDDDENFDERSIEEQIEAIKNRLSKVNSGIIPKKPQQHKEKASEAEVETIVKAFSRTEEDEEEEDFEIVDNELTRQDDEDNLLSHPFLGKEDEKTEAVQTQTPVEEQSVTKEEPVIETPSKEQETDKLKEEGTDKASEETKTEESVVKEEEPQKKYQDIDEEVVDKNQQQPKEEKKEDAEVKEKLEEEATVKEETKEQPATETPEEKKTASQALDQQDDSQSTLDVTAEQEKVVDKIPENDKQEIKANDNQKTEEVEEHEAVKDKEERPAEEDYKPEVNETKEAESEDNKDEKLHDDKKSDNGVVEMEKKQPGDGSETGPQEEKKESKTDDTPAKENIMKENLEEDLDTQSAINQLEDVDHTKDANQNSVPNEQGMQKDHETTVTEVPDDKTARTNNKEQEENTVVVE